MSCIIPAYNSAEFLEEALDSVFAQTSVPTETIVVDDGSTDDTCEIASRYSDRITLLRQANTGPAGARNLGLEAASGDYLTFLDADDVWHRDKLTRQLEVFARTPEVGFCITYVENFWIPEMKSERERLRDHTFSKPKAGYVCQALMARRSTFDKVGPFNAKKRIGEDTDWFVRAQRAGVVKQVLADVLVYRRIHWNNISYDVYRDEGARADMLETAFENLKRNRAQSVDST